MLKDQTESWIRIVNGIDKFVREAVLVQEEEKASGKPAAKARPMLKPSSASGWDFTPVEQRQWIDNETQESKDPHCFQVSKFITRLLRHSKQVNREADGAVHYDQVIEECKRKLSDDTGSWSDEMKQQFANVPFWSIDKWKSVLAKGGRTEEKVSILRGTILRNSCTFEQSKGIHESTINPALQDNVLLPEGFAKYIYHVGNGKELRSIVNHGLIPGGVSLKTGRQAVFFTTVNPMEDGNGMGETPCDLTKPRIAPYKNIWKHFQDTVF